MDEDRISERGKGPPLGDASAAARSSARYIMASDLHDKHILDTSAWNALFRDQGRDHLLKLVGATVVLPTTLAISEVAAIEDTEMRHALFQLMKSVGRDHRPLDMPNELMVRACQGYARRDPTITLNGGDEAGGAWIALQDPKLIDAEAQRLTLEFNQERELSFRQMNEGLRKELQGAFRAGLVRPQSMSALIRHYNRYDDFLYAVVNQMYERAVGTALPRHELRSLLNSLPEWPMFLVGYACAIYHRAIRDEGFGHGRNPGNLDLWSATYLPSCEVFITADKPQRRALKVINKICARPSQIISYKEWRERLLRAPQNRSDPACRLQWQA